MTARSSWVCSCRRAGHDFAIEILAEARSQEPTRRSRREEEGERRGQPEYLEALETAENAEFFPQT